MKKTIIIALFVAIVAAGCQTDRLSKVDPTTINPALISVNPPGRYDLINPCQNCQVINICTVGPCRCHSFIIDHQIIFACCKLPEMGPGPRYNLDDEDLQPMSVLIPQQYDNATGYGLIPTVNSYGLSTGALSASNWRAMRDTFLYKSDKGWEWAQAQQAMNIVISDTSVITAANASTYDSYWRQTISAFDVLLNGDSTDIVFTTSYKTLADSVLTDCMSKCIYPQLSGMMFDYKTDLSNLVGLTRAQVYAYYP